MDCRNHSNIEAEARCAGCAEGFCANCLIEINGQNYCKDCKYITVPGPPAIDEEENKIRSSNAQIALICAVIGLIINILGIVAIIRGIKAKNQISEDPNLSGEGMANAGIVIGIIDLIIWFVTIISK
jgi:hypothetical protein